MAENIRGGNNGNDKRPTYKYSLKMTLNVLNHLGLNLYSSIPAVLSEAIANCWDADASRVNINIDKDGEKIEIEDDGCGMDENDINYKYLNVGFQKRIQDGPVTSNGRSVMGRKGIGKLSLFSIANNIEIHSFKDGNKNGFVLNREKIEENIRREEDVFHPAEVSPENIEISKGTKIILTNLKRRITALDPHLREKLARRFSVIGEKEKFNVNINNIPISIADRDFYKKIQFLWTIGDENNYLALCGNRKEHKNYDGVIDSAKNLKLSGWVGAVEKSGSIKDDNKIILLTRGKLAQEDILGELEDGGLYSKYLIGEINADFLDLDDEEDIITSNRQTIIEDDPRYLAAKKYIAETLVDIRTVWNEWRVKYSTEKALKNPAIDQWYQSLKSERLRGYARKLFEKIQASPVENEDDRKEVYRYGILAFERLVLKDALEELNKIDSIDDMKFSSIFQDIDGVESVLYYEIASQRLRVINEFNKFVDKNELEKVVQKYIFDHLWLLHPSWERPTNDVYMERQVAKEFGDLDANLSAKEKEGRIDIKYRTAAGKHIIIELKRPSRSIEILDLVRQVGKYRSALQKCLKQAQREHEQIETICILGEPPTTDNVELNFVDDQLKTVHARFILYKALINDSLRSYSEYISGQERTSELKDILDKI